MWNVFSYPFILNHSLLNLVVSLRAQLDYTSKGIEYGMYGTSLFRGIIMLHTVSTCMAMLMYFVDLSWQLFCPTVKNIGKLGAAWSYLLGCKWGGMEFLLYLIWSALFTLKQHWWMRVHWHTYHVSRPRPPTPLWILATTTFLIPEWCTPQHCVDWRE